jgi:hypothetical protein
MEGQEINRLPASAMTVPELVEALVSRPDFSGIVLYDEKYDAEQGRAANDLATFNWRQQNCDPLVLCANMIPVFASIPRGPTPVGPPTAPSGNGQSVD